MPRTKEAELKITLDALPLAAYVFEVRSQRFISANRLFCDLVGYSEAELKELPWAKLLVDAAEVSAGQQAIESPQFNVPIVFHGRRKDGSRVVATLKYRPMRFVRDDDEVVDAFFTVVTSVEGEDPPQPATEVFKR